MNTRYHRKSPVEPAKAKRLELLLKGCRHQSFFSIDEIIGLLDCLPDAHLAGLQYIEFKANTSRRGGAYVQNSVNWHQLNHAAHRFEPYNPKRHIEIYPCTSQGQMKHAIYHEIAHFVYFNAISAVQRKNWVTKIYPRSSFVSDYAKINAAEDFAESYAFYLLDGAKLRKIASNKSVFIRSLF